MQDGHDESRDMLVAKHILEHGEKISVGPLAAGGYGWLQNSPIYFYLVTAIWFFAKTPLMFMKIWAGIMSLSPIIAFKVGEELKDKKLGLIAALIFATNVELIHESRQLLQPFLLPIFSLLFLWAILKTHKETNYFYLSMAIVFLLMQLHFHYGILLILPVGFFLVLKYWVKLLEKNPSPKNILIPLTANLSVGLLWLFSTYKKSPLDQIGFFLINFDKQHASFLEKFKIVLVRMGEIVFSWEFLQVSIPTIIVLAIIPLLVRDKEKDVTSKLKMIYLLAASIFLIILSGGFISTTYVLATLPFFLIIISFSIYQVFKTKPILGYFLLAIIIVRQFSTAFYIVNNDFPRESYYLQRKEISQVIADNYFYDKHGELPNFALAHMNLDLPFDLWGTTGFWYHLEEILDKKLIKIVNYGTNIKPLVSNADSFYLICEHRNLKLDEINKMNQECIQKFTDARNYLEPVKYKIFESNKHTVWKFHIKKNSQPKSYSHVYPELLKD